MALHPVYEIIKFWSLSKGPFTQIQAYLGLPEMERFLL